MSRIDTSRWRTRAKHEQTIIDLTHMIADLRMTLHAGEQIGVVLRQASILTISYARRDLERCTTSLSDMIKYQELADPRVSDHAGIIHTLNQLSIKLKLNEPIPDEMLTELERQIDALEDCREDMRSYRHVRGSGYVE